MKILFCWLALLNATAAVAGEGGFLFTTFKSETTPLSEQIYFVVSHDGQQWQELNQTKPVLVSSLGEKGVRDPYLVRAHDGQKFYLLATDLSTHFNGDWKRHVTEGSQSIVIWDSTNLVDWSASRLVKLAPDDAGCTWAPEAVYDETRQEYLTFWASTTGRDQFGKQRIWAAWTKDFVTFSAPFIYIEKPRHVIDTDIVRERGNYYRFSKDEEFKAITMEVSTNLLGPWRAATNFSLANLRGYEGPECYQLKPATKEKPATWCLIFDHYRTHSGYEPFVTEDLSGGQFKPGAGFKFPFPLRHGCVLPISAEEFTRLERAYGAK
ncbi:MAG: hypothetical protein RLZZ350_1818 [Verrucomicrobiota bacterium]